MLFEEIRSSLGARVVIWVSLILTLILSMITIMNTEQQTLMMLAKEKQAALRLANTIMVAIRHPMLRGDQDVIQLQFNYFSGLKGLEEIILCDDHGIVKRSSNSKILETPAGDIQALLPDFKRKRGDVQIIETLEEKNKEVFSDIMPIRNEDKCYVCHGSKKDILGVLKISLDWQNVLKEINSIKNRNFLISLFAVFAIGALSIIFLLRSVVYPIKKLEKGMSNVAKGNLDVKIAISSNDEIGKLTQMFNNMTSDLSALMQREKALAEREKQKSQQLEESVSLLKATLHATADGILVVDRKGVVTSFNDKFLDMWDIPKEIIDTGLENPLLDFMGGEIKSPEGAIDKVMQLYDHMQVNSFDILELKNGKIFERYSQPQESEQKIVGRVWSFRDITVRTKAEWELKEKKEELERSNADLQQFAYVSSHDLQEPLRMVAGYVKLLERRYKDKLDADAKEFIGYAVEGAARMSELINDLLAYSRVNTRGTKLKPMDCNIPFEKALFNLKTAIEENNVEINCARLPMVMGDETQLMQLFQNLISNAIKFRRNEPLRINISAEKKDDAWIFSVSDNGIGIKEDYFNRIFIIFQRLHNRNEYPGTGIGLALCKRIVERHEGRLWLKSKLGKGTTFYFSLKPAGGEKV